MTNYNAMFGVVLSGQERGKVREIENTEKWGQLHLSRVKPPRLSPAGGTRHDLADADALGRRLM